MTYLTEVIKKAGGLTLTTIRKYTLWIKPGSFYHLRVYQLKELKKCPHLVNLDPPKPYLKAPSMTSLRTHETTFEVARRIPRLLSRPSRRPGTSMWMPSNYMGATSHQLL